LVIVAESLVEVQPAAQIPSFLAPDAWDELDSMIERGDYWEMLLPSEFATPTPSLDALAEELDVRRRDDPLMVLHQLNEQLFNHFEYVPRSTKADSPIDLALLTHAGVCQDFAHVMITLVRSKLRIPCRYVSGYLFHREENGQKDRSLEGASHAWVEAFVPRLGWTAFDPTNNLIGGDRHIRVAIGRDYADVPPTRGVHKGEAASELSVAVTVSPSDAPPPELPAPSIVIQSRPVLARLSSRSVQEQQQQQ
jgi:transglutaminase-like putative cysteine protease